ncbi:MAG: hypothetical protein AVDCRST_MAG85-1374 [uncultured Solirubrobacteraceae bacterium]|uniref:Regulator of ribonuclease activity B domain-containing protein n=1 Tax=uncultured Solirubrobacteraceae bacterium TaxID=1162706 RepID=A0A6J4SK83_9ACTN|nr:MAG: hypothetical protein AVDCRST_MAG85-1374 [uncultured Solirubrobacteraceae bacterium]
MPLASFYLYFPDENGARAAGTRLQGSGYDVEVRLGADDVNWLALAEKDIPEGDLDTIEADLGRLAEELNGEYDGHEIDVSS